MASCKAGQHPIKTLRCACVRQLYHTPYISAHGFCVSAWEWGAWRGGAGGGGLGRLVGQQVDKFSFTALLTMLFLSLLLFPSLLVILGMELLGNL